MSDLSNNVGTKKKNKRRRKGKNAVKGSTGAAKLPEDVTDMPKQVSEDDPVITTVKCQQCKGQFRQTVVQNGLSISALKAANWTCPQCLHQMKAEDDRKSSEKTTHLLGSSSRDLGGGAGGNSGCNCSACITKRESTVCAELESDAQVTQKHWMEIRQMVRTIYRESMSLANPDDRAQIGSKEMMSIVSTLSSRDPHLFFQRLETLAREYLLEVKVRLLEQLSCGFNSPQLAIEFIQMLLDEYTVLCNALPSLLYLLKPVESCDMVKKLGLTVELMNKNIFRELIFAESFMSSNLPLIIAQLRLASITSDQYHRSTAEELTLRYTVLDEEMNEISRVWKSAVEHLNTQHLEDRKNHFERIRADGENFKQQIKMQSLEDKMEATTSKAGRESSREVPGGLEGKSLCEKHQNKDISSAHSLLKSHLNHTMNSSSEEVNEWSELLFRCTTPIGEPEFQIKGATAIQTLTLHVDTTKLDLSHVQPCCHRDQMLRYLDMGLTTEEVVEVSLKLAVLQKLGLHLKIEDLFDNEGFSLSDLNRLLVERPSSLPRVDGGLLFHSDDETETGKHSTKDPGSGEGEGCGCLYHSFKDEINFKYLREKVIQCQKRNLSKPRLPIHTPPSSTTSKGSEFMNGDRSRSQDFLQGLLMKVRFTRQLSPAEIETRLNNYKSLAPYSSQVTGSYDKVQVRLVQLELSGVWMNTTAKCLGHSLGMDKDLPCVKFPMCPLAKGGQGGKRRSDYMFVHTDEHQEFMDLLLDKRRGLDDVITAKETARRELTKKPQPAVDGTSKRSGGRGKSSVLVQDKENVFQTQDVDKPNGQDHDFQEKSCSSDAGVRPVTDCISSHTGGDSSGAGGINGCSFGGVKRTLKSSPYQSLRSQPCQCSACIGAAATALCPNYRIKLRDPSLESTDGYLGDSKRKGGVPRDKLGHHQTTPTDMPSSSDLDSLSPMAKEGLWQNWMSTSGSAQLENDSHVSNNNQHHGNHHHCIHGDEGDPYYGHDGHTSDYAPLATRSCNNHHSSDMCKNNGSQGSGGDSNSNSGDTPRRYCLCSYCELFGRNGPPTAPTSQNYTKRRDIMRQKLEEKKKRKDQKSSGSRPRGKQKVDEQTTVEELLAYIEGDAEDNEQSNTSKSSKKKKKQKKLQGNEDDLQLSNDQYIYHSGGQHSTNGTHTRTKGHHGLKEGGSREVAQDSEGGESGEEYDDELEEFKKFCFDDAPIGPRKKIVVALNMSDIRSKIQ